MSKASAERVIVPLERLGSAKIQPGESVRTPLYHQIYLLLRQKINEGIVVSGEILPGEFDLADHYGVSRITVKRALDELARDGFVTRERGRGTSVSQGITPSPLRASFEGQMEDLIAMGLETEVRLLSFDYGPASNEIAKALNLEPGTEVQRSIRLRQSQGVPFSHLTTFVPADIGHKFSAEDLSSKPLLALLEEAGVRVASAEQTISATLADTEIAEHLDLPVGSALLQVSRIVKDKKGRPVEYITALYRPDRYQYRMSLSRRTSDSTKVWSPSASGYKLS